MFKVAVNGGYCRGSSRLDHLLQRGGWIGAGGIYHARVCGARGQALRSASSKYSRRERWCIAIIMLRSVEYIGGDLPSVSPLASGVLAGVTIRCASEGGPFGVPTAARRVFAAAPSGGGGGVAGREISLIRTVFHSGVAEGFTEPLRAVGGTTGRFQEVTEA